MLIGGWLSPCANLGFTQTSPPCMSYSQSGSATSGAHCSYTDLKSTWQAGLRTLITGAHLRAADRPHASHLHPGSSMHPGLAFSSLPLGRGVNACCTAVNVSLLHTQAGISLQRMKGDGAEKCKSSRKKNTAFLPQITLS